MIRTNNDCWVLATSASACASALRLALVVAPVPARSLVLAPVLVPTLNTYLGIVVYMLKTVSG